MERLTRKCRINLGNKICIQSFDSCPITVTLTSVSECSEDILNVSAVWCSNNALLRCCICLSRRRASSFTPSISSSQIKPLPSANSSKLFNQHCHRGPTVAGSRNGLNVGIKFCHPLRFRQQFVLYVLYLVANVVFFRLFRFTQMDNDSTSEFNISKFTILFPFSEPPVPLPYRPEFTIIRTHEFRYSTIPTYTQMAK